MLNGQVESNLSSVGAKTIRCPFGHCTCNQRYLQWYLSQLLEVELNWIQVFCCFDLLDRQENPQSLPCASSKLNEFSKTYLKWMFFGSRHPLTATPPEGSTFFPVQDINFAPKAIPNCEIHLRHVKNQANKLSRNHVSPL